jgi:NAD(P)-dependent dehydrogenase (short-subunit alcohol dehydrogenase family)
MSYDFNPQDWRRRRGTQAMPLPLLSEEVDIKHWTAIVTGANTGSSCSICYRESTHCLISGIGYEIAKNIAIRGAARVILACENEAEGCAAEEALTRETGCQQGVIEYRHLDLASFASVRSFVQRHIDERLPLHILVNNMDVYSIGKRWTEDGLDFV